MQRVLGGRDGSTSSQPCRGPHESELSVKFIILFTIKYLIIKFSLFLDNATLNIFLFRTQADLQSADIPLPPSPNPQSLWTLRTQLPQHPSKPSYKPGKGYRHVQSIRCEKRKQFLARVTQALGGAKQLPRESYKDFWLSHGPTFEQSSATEGGNIFSDFLERLSLMLLAHKVDSLVLSIDVSLRSGHGRKTAAFETYAKENDMSTDDVRKYYKRSRAFYQILDEEGPGSLLEMGCGVKSL